MNSYSLPGTFMVSELGHMNDCPYLEFVGLKSIWTSLDVIMAIQSQEQEFLQVESVCTDESSGNDNGWECTHFHLVIKNLKS